MSVMHGVPFAPDIAAGPGRINAAPGPHSRLEPNLPAAHSRTMVTVATSQPVPLWRLFLRMGGWFAVLFFVVSAALTLISHAELMLAERFDAEGVRTEAVVEDRYIRESRDSDGDKQITYYLVLAFQTETGAPVTATETVSRSLYQGAEPRSKIPIRYLRSDPQRIETREGQNRTTSRVFQFAGLVFGVLALAGLWYSGRLAVAAVRARRYGVRESALVTELKRTRWTVNNRYRYRLVWREASGRMGESLAYPLDALDDNLVGNEIGIYQGIKRAWWVGDVGERSGEG